MHGKDLLASIDIGSTNHHLAVETAGAEQGGIEHVGPVGGSDDDDAFIGIETVHLHQQLVQRLLAFVVATTQASAAAAAHGVDFIDKDDARGRLLALFEHVADTAGADTDEHFNEIGAGDGEERHIGFAGNGAGEQRLAGAGRANEQRALRNLAAQSAETARILQEVDDFLQFLAGFVDAGHVVKGHAAFLLHQQLGAGFAETHGATASAVLHLAHDEDPDANHQDEWQHVEEQLRDHRTAFFRAGIKAHALGAQTFDQLGVAGVEGAELLVTAGAADDFLAADLHRFHSAIIHARQEIRIGQCITAARRAGALHHVHRHG